MRLKIYSTHNNSHRQTLLWPNENKWIASEKERVCVFVSSRKFLITFCKCTIRKRERQKMPYVAFKTTNSCFCLGCNKQPETHSKFAFQTFLCYKFQKTEIENKQPHFGWTCKHHSINNGLHNTNNDKFTTQIESIPVFTFRFLLNCVYKNWCCFFSRRWHWETDREEIMSKQDAIRPGQMGAVIQR